MRICFIFLFLILSQNLEAKKQLSQLDLWITEHVSDSTKKNPLLRVTEECREFDTLTRDQIRAVDHVSSVALMDIPGAKLADPSVTCAVNQEFEDVAPFTDKIKSSQSSLMIDSFKKVEVLGEKNKDAINYVLVLSSQKNPKDKLKIHCRMTGKNTLQLSADSLAPYLAQALGCKKAEYDYKITVGEPIFETPPQDHTR